MDNTRAAVGVSIVVAVVGFFTMPARGQAGKPFVLPSSCTVPFADIETLRSIDKNCGIFGDSPTTSPEHQEQNRRKNNLCATTSPSDITVADLVSLQEKVDASGLKYDREHLPADRSSLEKLGEGTVVRIVGLIEMAQFSNKKMARV